MSTTILSSKGQVVVPAEIRRRLGLTSGDHMTVTMSADGGAVELRKLESLDEMADRLSRYMKPGTAPLMDVHGFYDQRSPRA